MGRTPNFLEGEFNLPQLEEKVLTFWAENDVFEKTLGKNQKKKFVFYEGPPYANGKPAIHHVLARVVKDVVLRYKTMRGYYVPRRAGWDTHGLPVEIAAEKALGLKNKREVEQYGIQHFNEKAKEQVWLHKDEWERLTKRIGYWLDLKNAYVTYTPEYIETIWWTLAEIWKRKLLYKGHKVVPWCTRCGTALSSHELAQGYKETADNSAFVKFKVKPGQKFGKYEAKDSAYILSWTTTPWTLPGNVALAVGEKISYTALRVKDVRELYILASDLVKTVFEGKEVEIVHEGIKGKDLVGLEYEPLFSVAPLQKPLSYKVYPASFVTTTDGTGVVHTAVMYGEDDYALGKKIGLPEHHTVTEEGKFTQDVPGLAGSYVKSKETEEKIFAHLRERGNLLAVKSYVHDYPYCWRCGTAILYYARTSWFIAMSKLRAQLLKNNESINWMPEHVKEGRFGEWLREVKDWNLSRERYWGAPLPVWECKKCAHTEVVGSLAELSKLSGGSKNHYWVMRHGESESNLFDIIDAGERKYLNLTPRGKKQAEASALKFKKLLAKQRKKIDLVISSDITRTKETEAIMQKVLGVEKVIFDKQIEEVHLGPGLTGYRDERYLKKYPTYEERFEQRPDGGESLRDLRVRMWNFIKETEKKYQGKNILIVSHEYPIWMLFHAAEGWSEKRAIEETLKRDRARKAAAAGRGFIGFAEVHELNMVNIPRNDTGEVDLHRPFADAVDLPCPKCKGDMKRVREVADVWYDSGAMPYAQTHYPFNAAIDYPADYIAEGMDQTRGWFYTLLAIATALGRKAPYKNVITFGLINDKFGKKMSKSVGNVVEPFAVMDKFGVDALRWYFYSGTPFGEPKNFDELEIGKALRRTHLIVYNSFVFWKTYADQQAKLPATPKNILDQWILARLAEVNDSVSKKLDRYQIREASLELESLIDDLSRWFIRRSRRRLQKPDNTADYKAASATLAHVLFVLTNMMAPFTPFFSEALYAPLGGKKLSVHLEEWPTVNKKLINKKLTVSMKAVRDFATAGLAKRAEAGIKVRQPLASMTVNVKLDKVLQDVLMEEVNVKKIVYAANSEGVSLDTVLTEALREEGIVRELMRMAQELRQKAALVPKDRIAVMLAAPDMIRDIIMKNEKSFLAGIGGKSIEYRKSDKFQAEEQSKIDGQEVWLALRKVSGK